MSELYIAAALPNPAGKDRPLHGGPSNEQLNNEWVEFSNPNLRATSIAGVSVSHYAFDRRCKKTGETTLTTFSGNLEPHHSVRLHTGTGRPRSEGSRRHLYLGHSNYVWNNACGDTAVLRKSNGTVIDWARYAPNPPEGQILKRVLATNQLS